MFTRNDLLDIAIKMEENEKAVYDRALNEIKNKKLKTLLHWYSIGWPKRKPATKIGFYDKKKPVSRF